MENIEFFLKPMPPFRLDYTVWVLRRRPDNAWDHWKGQIYRRIIPLSDSCVDVSVVQTGPPEAPYLKIVGRSSAFPVHAEELITSALERLLGLRSDLTLFYEMAAADPFLAPLAQTYRGVKPPRFLSLFESLVNAIACQQLSLTVGIRLLNSLCDRYGRYSLDTNSTNHAFPLPEDLAGSDLESMRTMGFSRQKALAIIMLANSSCDGALDLDAIETMDDELALENLLKLRGVGRWTAEYALLRGMGRQHIFPGDDVGARNNLIRWLNISQPLDYDGIGEILRHWRPYAGLIYFHLLLASLAKSGLTREKMEM